MNKCLIAIALLFASANSEALKAVCHRDNDKRVVICEEDKLGRLMWQDNTDYKYEWNDSRHYCEKLGLAGYSDWRLPNRFELLSITDDGRYNPAINEAFKNVESGKYWTSEKGSHSKDSIWNVNFIDGSYGDFERSSDRHFIRCVRNY